MKLRDLITKLEGIEAECPDTEIDFQTIGPGLSIFTHTHGVLLDVHPESARCIFTVGVTDDQIAAYQQYLTNRKNSRKR